MADSKEIILITGGSGLIGQRLASHFKQNYQVVSLDIKGPKSPDPDIGFINLDMSKETVIKEALEKVRQTYGNQIASVIHLAAFYSFDVEDDEKYEIITVQGTRSLLKALQSFNVGQFIFSSTMLVHSPVEIDEEITEDSEVAPRWSYPASKVRAENIIHAEHGNIPILILRIAGVYDDRCHSIPIGNHIERINEHHITSHFFPGDVNTGSAFIHMDDLVSAFSKAVEKRKTIPQDLTLILGEEDTMTFKELQEEIAGSLHDKKWITQRIPKGFARMGAWMQERIHFGEKPFIKSWMVKLADHHYQLNTSKAQSILDWKPEHDLRSTLPKMIEFLKSDPVTFYKENKLSPPINPAVAVREKLPAIGLSAGLGLLTFYVFRKNRKVNV